MTTENQTTNLTTTIEEPNYSKATSVAKRSAARASDKPAVLKTLSLRPTKSVKRNDSFKPTKKLR